MERNDDDDSTNVDSSTIQSDEPISRLEKIIFILICLCNMVQNAIVGGANNAIMTTLETGFYMTSTETGLFQSVYEFIALFTYPFIGYFGDRSGRKVRWISISMLILTIGFLVMSFPHLVESKRGRPALDSRVADHLTLCNPNRTISVCSFSNNLRFLSHLKYVFYLSNVINACGSAALPTLAVTLIEDIFPQEKAPLAQGIYYALGGVGIGLGFLATSQFLKVYTYIKKPVWLTPNYSEWVGAWWLVYALGTCLSFTLCLLLCLFDIGRCHRYYSSRNTQNSSNDSTENSSLTRTNSISTNLSSITNENKRPSLLIVEQPMPTIIEAESLKTKDFCFDMITLIKQLIFNLRYMGVTACAIIEALLIKGYLAFLSKHIEYQFRTTSSHSSVYMGVISLFSVIFGTPLGAYFVKRFRMNGQQCAKFCCIILSISSIFFLGLMLHCREPTIGTTHFVPVISTAFDPDFFDEPLTDSDRYESSCKRKCKCDMNIYQPVCDLVNQETYQNPCLLGCKKILKGKYADCLCLPTNSTVIVGRCKERKCTINLIITLCGALIVVFMSCCVIVPALECTLHSVQSTHRAFSLGFKSTLTKSLGYLPGTILFGAIIDRTCKTWIRETCGYKDQCKHYNNKRMAISLAVLGFGFRSLSALCCGISWYSYSKMSDTAERKNSKIITENQTTISTITTLET